jgi:16S rRNA (cytidine1402-2'-O)-methyltransferase
VGSGTLFLVGTPIGNLEDLSDRARRVLGEVDVVAAEDTRRTGRLLASIGVSVRLLSFFEGNEAGRTPEVVELLRSGTNVALVTDAGMPSVSDPGYRLVATCVEAALAVDVVPGPSAALAALVLSGLPTDRFVFEGFLPRTGKARRLRLAALAHEARTVVLFESPKRLAATLADLSGEDAERRVAVCRELTKLHQEVIRGSLAEVTARLATRELKGEVVVVLAGARPSAGEEPLTMARRLLAEGASKREAARQARAAAGGSARDIYEGLVAAERADADRR